METIKKNIIPVILIGLVIYSIFNTNSIKTDVQGYKNKIDSIGVKVDSAKSVNKEIDNKIVGVNDKILSVTKEIHQIDNNITIVKQNTDEKVNNLNHVGNVELEQLFTARYNQGSTSN
jgi:peptidoglycan hydrolase CwlO-like protein